MWSASDASNRPSRPELAEPHCRDLRGLSSQIDFVPLAARLVGHRYRRDLLGSLVSTPLSAIGQGHNWTGLRRRQCADDFGGFS